MMNTIQNREVFRVGTHNGDKYTSSDLDAMVAAFSAMDFKPAIKIGHAQNGSDAYGYVDKLRRDGDRLIADFTDIDESVMQKIKDKKLTRVSGEVYWNFKRDGKTYSRVLGAVALLGHEIPGVAGLKPLHEFTADDDKRVYEIEFATGDDQRGNADSVTQEQNTMSMEALQAELAALRKDYEAQQATLKTYEGTQDKIATYESKVALLQAETDRLRSEATKRMIDEKVAGLKLPALHSSFAALYALDSQETKVKFYDASTKQSVDKTMADVLDGMVAHLNEKIAPMLKSYSVQDEEAAPEADNTVDAGKELDKLASARMIKDKSDYATALRAVTAENQELARVYFAKTK